MKNIVGVFDTHEHAQQVVRELVDMGLDRNDISLLANNRSSSTGVGTGAPLGAGEPTGLGDQKTADGTTVGENVAGGALFGGIGGLLIGLGALAIPGIGPVVAAGPLAATLAGAGFGALGGGLIGAIKDLGVPDEDANLYAESVRRGSTIVSVQADDRMIDSVEDVMNRNGAIDVDERHSQYRAAGFSGFSHDAQPYDYDETATRRSDLTGAGLSSPGSLGSGSMGSAGGATLGGSGTTGAEIAGSGDVDRTTRNRARIYPRA